MTTHIEPTAQNVNKAMAAIEKYAADNGYVMNGEMPRFKERLDQLFKKTLEFQSNNQKKIVRNYLTRFSRKISRSQANRFMHLLWRHVLKQDGQAPYVELSETEQKIKAAKLAWKAARDHADKLLMEYKQTKGDFYKKR